MDSYRFRTIPGLYLPSLGKSELEALTHIFDTFKLAKIRFTPSNQIAVANIDDAELIQLIEQLKLFMEEIDTSKVTVLSCQGCNNCAIDNDGVSKLAQHVKEIVTANELPAKCKIAVAGCARCCTMPFVRDLGLIPSPSGWRLIFGGNGGANPRIGNVIGEKLEDEELSELIAKCFSVYRTYGRPKQRTSRFIESFGLQRFKKEILSK